MKRTRWQLPLTIATMVVASASTSGCVSPRPGTLGYQRAAKAAPQPIDPPAVMPPMVATNFKLDFWAMYKEDPNVRRDMIDNLRSTGEDVRDFNAEMKALEELGITISAPPNTLRPGSKSGEVDQQHSRRGVGAGAAFGAGTLIGGALEHLLLR